MLEPCRSDKFTVEGDHVDIMESIEIGHDSKGLFADWHVKSVEVFNPKGATGGLHLYSATLSKKNWRPFSFGF